MAKIYIGDHLGQHRTTIQMEKWFTAHGHEVHWDTYYEPDRGPLGPTPPNPSWIEWADVILFEWLEGMVELCLKAGWGKKKPVYARAMDIEIWANNSSGADWTDLTGIAYTSKYMFSLSDKLHNFKQYPKLKTAHIPLSIDMNEWTYKERKPGHNVAVIGHMWDAKGPNLIPQFVRQLIDKSGDDKWKFYIQGDWRHDVWEWYWQYMNHIIKELELEKNIILDETHVESIDKWLEDKDFVVSFSHKDAFSLPMGEAMAKGIKTLPHNFMGAKDIWGKYVWSSFSELFGELVLGDYDSKEYYTFVKDHYSNEVVMPKWNRFLNIPL